MVPKLAMAAHAGQNRSKKCREQCVCFCWMLGLLAIGLVLRLHMLLMHTHACSCMFAWGFFLTKGFAKLDGRTPVWQCLVPLRGYCWVLGPLQPSCYLELQPSCCLHAIQRQCMLVCYCHVCIRTSYVLWWYTLRLHLADYIGQLSEQNPTVPWCRDTCFRKNQIHAWVI